MSDTGHGAEPPPIGVALSGGGHRASTWALGALLYLVDAGIASRVRSIASVSGGSITNGFVALRSDYMHTSATDFVRDVAAPLAKHLATDGTVFADRASRWVKRAFYVFGATWAVGSIATTVLAVGGWVTAKGGGLGLPLLTSQVLQPALAVVSVLGMLLLLAAGARGAVTRRGYDRALYQGRRLADLEGAAEHVFCTTDLQFAEHVYWSSKFVYSYRSGVGRPGNTLLADAVAASAAFPGGFPPLVFRASEFGFEAGAEALPARLVLLDGGIYDNMAEQWFVGAAKRLSGRDQDPNAKVRAEMLTKVTAIEQARSELLIVNATPAFSKKEMRFGWWPAVEVAALVRTVFALHDNATSLRRKFLVDGFVAAERTGGRAPGTLVHIGTSPDATVAYVESNRTAALAQRDRAASARRLLSSRLGLHGAAVDWDALVKRNKRIPTHLEPLGVARVADLMQHASVLAAVQCHVFLGYPLPPEEAWVTRFGRARFEALARGEGLSSKKGK